MNPGRRRREPAGPQTLAPDIPPHVHFKFRRSCGGLLLPLPQAPPDKVSGLIHAATLLAQLLGQGRAIDSRALRSAHAETAFCWHRCRRGVGVEDAYEACEAAQVPFLRKFGAAMRTRAGSTAAMLEMLTRLAGRLASQTRRSCRIPSTSSNSRPRWHSAL